jgi:hypothetical protein
VAIDLVPMAALMNQLPEVTWDRCVVRDFAVSAFGWIGREDGRSDYFLLIYFAPDNWVTSTSSARYSREFNERLHGATDTNHQDCSPVREAFGVLVERSLSRS